MGVDRATAMTGDSGAGRRWKAEDFPRALAELQAPVMQACRENDEWPAKVAASIYAALDFVAADPAAARVLTVDPRVHQRDSGSAYFGMIERFANLLDAVAPSDERLPVSSDVALVGGIAKVIGDHVRSARVDRLGEIGPELVQFALLPYLGFAEAKRWAERPTQRDSRAGCRSGR